VSGDLSNLLGRERLGGQPVDAVAAGLPVGGEPDFRQPVAAAGELEDAFPDVVLDAVAQHGPILGADPQPVADRLGVRRSRRPAANAPVLPYVQDTATSSQVAADLGE
jgi:hypothetical protein